MYLSIDFQENYKRLDRLCKDYLSSNEGISEYIKQMENTAWTEQRYVVSWEEDYKQLKHVRWVRNQLAHEVGTLEAGICTAEDLNYIKDFYDRILNGNDPFALIRKVKEKIREQQQAKQRTLPQETIAVNKQQQEKHDSLCQETIVVNEKCQKPSLWNRIVAKIKKLFGE